MLNAFWVVVFLGLSGLATSAQPSMQTILTNGPVSNRLNIVLLSEAYTTNQLPQFLADATNAVSTLLSHPPYQEYASYCNAFAISVASKQSGSDHPSYPQLRDTYFNSTYNLSDTLITIPTNNTGQGRVDTLLKSFMPRCHLAILLVNDPARGGSDGFDKAAILSAAAIGIEQSLQQPYILSHETGHLLANLGDEYTNSYPGFPNTEEPNTTRETRRGFIKWNAWISTNTPIPTPVTDTDDIGLFQGAHYHATNWYRPRLNCAMGAAGVPFCEVCREALTLAFYKRVRPVDGFAPILTNLWLTKTQAQTFNLTLLQPATHNLSLQWYTNGTPIVDETNLTFNLAAETLGNGSNWVRAVISDQTAFVRNDPAKLLRQAITWGVTTVRPAPSGTPGRYAGIYLGNLSGDYSNTNSGIAIIVRTNNQATLIGSALGLTNAIGLYAQFQVQSNGAWSFQTNGVSAAGQVYTKGVISGELDFDGGGISQIGDAALQPDLGPFQSQAGYYSGRWSGGGKTGKMFGLLSALGQIAYCMLDEGDHPFDGGGSDPLIRPGNQFDSLSVNGLECAGTLTNATRIIAGKSSNSDVAFQGSFLMSRAGFVPINQPPAITSAPQHKTIPYGGNGTFTVMATGTTPLYYQWYSAPGSTNDFAIIADATDPTLVITNVSATSHTIYKVMVQNFVGETNAMDILTAVPEVVAPTLKIISPVPGQRVSNDVFSVSGQAADNVRLAGIWYQLNTGPPVQADGTGNWSASVRLIAGTNVLAAYAKDSSGNSSITQRVSFFFVVPSTLTLITNGLGGISHGFNGNLLEVGKTYAVTAVAGAGQIFSNWEGSVSSSLATLSFLMQTNMSLQANFIGNPFPAAEGFYSGLFAETNRTHDRSGFMTLTLGDHGAYTASLKRGTNSYGFSGQFSVAGYASRIVMVGGSSWTVTMTLDLEAARTLSGTVSSGSWTAELLAQRAAFNAATNPATQFKGCYTLIVPGNDDASASPGGDGFGTVVVGAGGYGTLSGWLADGFAWSESVPLSSAGEWALYVPLYGGMGSVWGWLQFDTNSAAEGTLTGTLSWIRPARPAATLYRAGFTNEITANGSRYTAPTNGNTRVIALTNGVVWLDGGNLSAPFTNQVTLTSSNRVISTNKMSLNIIAADGTFSGSAKVPGTARTNSFKGALFQDANAGYGYFLGTNQSGRVVFEAP